MIRQAVKVFLSQVNAAKQIVTILDSTLIHLVIVEFCFRCKSSLSFLRFASSSSLTEILVDRLVLVPSGVSPVSTNAARENDGDEEKEEEQSGNGDRELGDHHDRRVRDWNSRLALNGPVLSTISSIINI